MFFSTSHKQLFLHQCQPMLKAADEYRLLLTDASGWQQKLGHSFGLHPMEKRIIFIEQLQNSMVTSTNHSTIYQQNRFSPTKKTKNKKINKTKR